MFSSVETNCLNIREYSNIAEPNEYFPCSNTSSRRQRLFQFSVIFIETLHRCTLPRARWPPNRNQRNDSNRPTQPGSSYRLPVLLKAALFLLFWLIKEKKWRPIKIYGIQVKTISGGLFENATASPGFCCKLRLQTLVSLEVEFSFFFTMQAWWFQGQAKHFNRKKRWKLERTYRPGAVARSNWE